MVIGACAVGVLDSSYLCLKTNGFSEEEKKERQWMRGHTRWKKKEEGGHVSSDDAFLLLYCYTCRNIYCFVVDCCYSCFDLIFFDSYLISYSLL